MNLSLFSRPTPIINVPSRRRGRALAGLLTAAAVIGATPALAAPGCHGAAITVTGEGEAVVQPDLATINLGVTTQAPTAADAMAQNSTSQTAVMEALTAAGIEPRDVQTSGLQLTPMMQYGENQPPKVTGYQAQNIVTIRVRDLAALGSTLDTIVTAGANEINGITFSRDDADAVQDEARRDAVADAQHRAEVMAEAAGLTLGPVLGMRDAVFSAQPMPEMGMMRAMDASAAKQVPIAGGELAMTAQIEMRFALTGGEEACAGMGHGGKHGMHHGGGAGGGAGEMPMDDATMPEGDTAPQGDAPATDAAPEGATEGTTEGEAPSN